MTTYSEKLRKPAWQKKRLSVLERDKFTCILCGDDETELHVHHKKYTGEPEDAPLEDLTTLCKFCHKFTEEAKSNSWEIMGRMKFILPSRSFFYTHIKVIGKHFILIESVMHDRPDCPFYFIPASSIKTLYNSIVKHNG